MPKRNIYQEVTEYILEALEKGVGPWICPYEVARGPHRNALTGRPYRGINILLLNVACWTRGFRNPLWLTYREARRLGGYVKRGERATSVIFWKIIEVEERDPLGQPVIDAQTGKPRIKKVPFARWYYVFNIEQCEGLKIFFKRHEEKEDPLETEDLLKKFHAIPEIRQGSIPAYYPLLDVIEMPPKGAFESPEHYWGTFLHELTHWTGHPSRLNRKLEENRFGDQTYAFEELVAEMGSAFLGAHAGLPIRKLRHPEYIQNWLEVLQRDTKAIFTASRLAQEACDWLLERVGTEAGLKEAA